MGKQNFRCHLTPRDAFFLLISEGGCGGRWGTLGHIQIRFKKQVFEVRAERKLLHTTKYQECGSVRKQAPVSWAIAPGPSHVFYFLSAHPTALCGLGRFQSLW